MQELRETLAEELDFEHEGHNQERCAHDMVNFPYVYIPKVMTSPHICNEIQIFFL